MKKLKSNQQTSTSSHQVCRIANTMRKITYKTNFARVNPTTE